MRALLKKDIPCMVELAIPLLTTPLGKKFSLLA